MEPKPGSRRKAVSKTKSAPTKTAKASKSTKRIEPTIAPVAPSEPVVAAEIRRALSSEERREMIARAAYYRAAKRGFQGGNPLQDWLDAEAEVDAALLARTGR